MKSPTDQVKSLRAVLRGSRKSPKPDLPFDPQNPIGWLLHSLLLWEATTPQADKAYCALRDAFIDDNDLRVALPHELVEVIGGSYPTALDRCNRIRAVLNHIYRTEHHVSICRLRELGKREVRMYLDSLEGMTAYAAARTALMAFDAHTIPADARLSETLAAEGVIESGVDPAELASWLSRHIRAEQAQKAHCMLQALVDRRFGKRRSVRSKKSKKESGASGEGGSSAASGNARRSRRSESREAGTR